MNLSIQIGPLINLFIDGSMQIELLIIFQESFNENEKHNDFYYRSFNANVILMIVIKRLIKIDL